MTRPTFIKSPVEVRSRLAVLRVLKAHILQMIEFYQRTRSELGLSPDPDIPGQETLLKSIAVRSRGDQEPAS